jgi:hypothetical protein
MTSKDALGGVFLFFFGILTAYLSARMPIGSFRLPGPGMFPLCLGLLLVVLSTIFTFGVFLRDRRMKEEDGQPPVAVTSLKRVVGFMGTIAAAAALLGVLGYAPTAFLLILTLLRLLGLRGWRWNVLIALTASVFSHFLFVEWLKIPFPQGWFGI